LRQTPSPTQTPGKNPDSGELRLHTPECMDSRFEQFVQFALIASATIGKTITSTLYSVRRIRTSPTNLRFFQYNVGLVFHTIYSGIFHPCYLLLLFPLLEFPPLQFCPYRIFYSRSFSRPLATKSSSGACKRKHRQISVASRQVDVSTPGGADRQWRCYC